MTNNYLDDDEEEIEDDFEENPDELLQISSNNPLLQTHPELYGRLLLANKKLDDSSASLFFLFFVFSVVICSTLHEIGWKAKLGIQAGWWASFFLYLIICLFFFVLLIRIDDAREAQTYQKIKHKLISAINNTRINRYELLPTILNDDDLSKIADYLSDDEDFVD